LESQLGFELKMITWSLIWVCSRILYPKSLQYLSSK